MDPINGISIEAKDWSTSVHKKAQYLKDISD